MSTLQIARPLLPFSISFLLHVGILGVLLFSKSSHLIRDVGDFQLTNEALEFVSVESVTSSRVAKASRPRPQTKPEPLLDTVSTLANTAVKAPDVLPTTASAPEVARQNSSASQSSATGAADALSQYLGKLRRLINEQKVYPALSRRMSETGKVVVTLNLKRDGTIQNVRVKQPSSYERLNAAALETVSGVQKFERMPDDVSSDSLEVEVPIEFSL